MVCLVDFHESQTISTANHYESGLRAVSKDMLNEGVIAKPLEEMTAPEFEIAIFNILHNDFFIDKNNRGNKMYSNSLKQYQCFIKSAAKQEDYIQSEDTVKNDTSILKTDREQLVKARIGQGIFREKLIKKYSSCIISGIRDERLLVASHVKPWIVSNNEERLDVENGLLLSPLYDKMFDIGLISFENSGKVLLSNSVNKFDREKFCLNNNICYDLKISESLKEYLEYHRDVIFVA
jgi:predicted restriction endonuclease